jgi:hypothetical protein
MGNTKTEKIMLEYSLHENPLTENNEDFVAQTHSTNSYNKEQFIDLMLQRGTLMTKTDALAVFNNIEETLAYILRNGWSVKMPLFTISFSISGIFDGATDSFDPRRHRVFININKGTILRNVEGEVDLVKVNIPSPQPQIIEAKDSVTGKVDEVLTAGGAVEIHGINIKITGDNPDCGLFFVDEGGRETKAETVIINKPASLIALIPLLQPDSYRLKIVTQYSGSNNLKDPKTTIYGKIFQVR